MRIPMLFTLLFVATGAVALAPERASAQARGCVYCDRCWFPSSGSGEMCVLLLPSPSMGFTQCSQPGYCQCNATEFGWCEDMPAGTAEAEAQLAETLAAIKASRPIPADGRFFYARRGADYVIRRKCDAVEVGRLAVAEVESAPTMAGG